MLLKGRTITLIERTQSGVNAFNEPTYIETQKSISNVLIEPTGSAEIANELEMYGRHSAYTLHIPKGDTNEWLDCLVELGGEFGQRTYKQFGDVQVYQTEYLPLDWSKKVKVEVYE